MLHEINYVINLKERLIFKFIEGYLALRNELRKKITKQIFLVVYVSIM